MEHERGLGEFNSSPSLVLPSSIFGFVFPDNHFHHPLLYFLFVSQISRACDECRRRKTKCDLVGCFPGEPAFQEAPLEKREQQSSNDWGMIILQPCANCVRSDLQCCYTKRSQKRPGKGYIKELERRLDHLENVALVPLRISDRNHPIKPSQQLGARSCGG